MKGFLAAQIIIKPLNVLLLKMFNYSIVSSYRAVIADYKVARAKMRTHWHLHRLIPT